MAKQLAATVTQQFRSTKTTNPATTPKTPLIYTSTITTIANATATTKKTTHNTGNNNDNACCVVAGVVSSISEVDVDGDGFGVDVYGGELAGGVAVGVGAVVDGSGAGVVAAGVGVGVIVVGIGCVVDGTASVGVVVVYAVVDIASIHCDIVDVGIGCGAWLF